MTLSVPYVKDAAQVEKILEEAKESGAIVCYTIVSPELREHIMQKAMELDVEVVDVLGPMLKAIEKTSGLLPKNQAGLIHALDHEYFKRVEAIEFAVKYDDGKNPLGLLKADVVLIGVSRTSKTPLSMYLAHKQLKVANVPLVPEITPPEELFKVPPHKIIGLLIDPFKLNEIRSERLKTMGLSDGANYADVRRISEELEYAKAIMRRNSVPYEAVSLSSMKSRATGPAIASRRMVQIHAVDRLRMNAVLIESFILFLFPDAYVKPISGTIPWEIPCPIA